MFADVLYAISREPKLILERKCSPPSECYKSPWILSSHIIGDPNHNTVCDGRVCSQFVAKYAGLNLSSANSVPIDIQHVVRSAMYREEAWTVIHGNIALEKDEVRHESIKICLLESFCITCPISMPYAS